MKKLSIAIFGNTNNYPFLLAQGLRAIGHKVTLIINRRERLHRPESRYPQYAHTLPDWIYDHSYLTDDDIAYLTPKVDDTLQRLCKGQDLVILNDYGPSLATFIRCPHVSLLTGSDLTFLASFDMHAARTSSWSTDFKRSVSGRRNVMAFSNLVARQRDGICASNLVCFAHKGLLPDGDRILDDIGVPDKRRLMLYFSNTLDLELTAPPKNQVLTLLSAARVTFDRMNSPHLSDCDFKGTDVLIKGYSMFIESGGIALLKLPNKGVDVEKARTLITQLRLSDSIEWYEELPLFALYDQMRAADIVVDQLGQSFPAMVTGDAYALGRPVMANFRNEILSDRFGIDLPGLNVTKAEEVASTLFKIQSMPHFLEPLGIASRKFAEEYMAPCKQATQLLETL